MKKIYLSPLVHEYVTSVEVGFCGSNVSANISISDNTNFGNYVMDGED